MVPVRPGSKWQALRGPGGLPWGWAKWGWEPEQLDEKLFIAGGLSNNKGEAACLERG